MLKCVSDINGIVFHTKDFPWGCDYYLQNGRMLDKNAYSILKDFDAILMGAVGDREFPTHISEAGYRYPFYF